MFIPAILFQPVYSNPGILMLLEALVCLGYWIWSFWGPNSRAVAAHRAGRRGYCIELANRGKIDEDLNSIFNSIREAWKVFGEQWDRPIDELMNIFLELLKSLKIWMICELWGLCCLLEGGCFCRWKVDVGPQVEGCFLAFIFVEATSWWASPNLATLSVGELIQATLLVYMGQVVEWTLRKDLGVLTPKLP